MAGDKVKIERAAATASKRMAADHTLRWMIKQVGVRLRNPRALRRKASSRSLMASVGPLEAWWSKKARMSWGAPPQGAAELGDLLQPGGHAAADGVDQCGHRAFPATPVGVGVGGDDLLVDHVGDLDPEVFVGVQHAGQPVVLARREQLKAGAGDVPDSVERISGVPAPTQSVLLDALADQIQLGSGQRDDVEGDPSQ